MGSASRRIEFTSRPRMQSSLWTADTFVFSCRRWTLRASPRPIDGFFDSLAADLREDAIGIVLSGTGSDGSLGLKAIKECGGLTIAQGSDGAGPEHQGMPAGAIATGVVDLVAPVEAIPAHLLRLSAPDLKSPASEASPEADDAARLAICKILQSAGWARFQRLSRQNLLASRAAPHAGAEYRCTRRLCRSVRARS